MTRSDLAIKGSIIGIISQLVSLLLKFLVRTVTIHFLGIEILGLDSVLLDVVSMLSLAELGVTSAMVYRLYKPLIEADDSRVSELMATYKYIYNSIAIVIAIVGIGISFLLPHIIKGIDVSWKLIYGSYYLYLINTVSSYLPAYQRLLLNADNKKHFCILVDLGFNVIFSACKIISLTISRSYSLYIIFTIAQTICANLYLRIYAHNQYKEIDFNAKRNKSDFRLLLNDTKEVIGGKLAGYVYSSTDNMIISTFLSTATVGVLSNYKYITQSLKTLVNSAMSTIQPLLGNLLNSETSIDKSFLILKRYTFIRYLLAGSTTVPFIVIADIFVNIWTGSSSYIMGKSITILLAIDYYVGCVYGPLGEYILAKGMFSDEKKVTIIGALSNLVLSLIGIYLCGVQGVLFATIISQLVLWIGKGKIVFSNIYKCNKTYTKTYLVMNIRFGLSVLAAICFASIVVRFCAPPSLILSFIFGGCISVITFLIVTFCAFYKTDDYKYTISLIKKLLRKGK